MSIEGGLDTPGIARLIDALLPKGIVSQYTGAAAPDGWMICDCSAISRTVYVKLFSVISTTYGVGDGSTTYNLPDYRGHFLRGAGTHGTAAKAAGGNFAGPSLGARENDAMQSHKHATVDSEAYGLLTGGTYPSGGAFSTYTDLRNKDTGVPKTDGTNGTPRIGNETKPANYGVNFIIKY